MSDGETGERTGHGDPEIERPRGRAGGLTQVPLTLFDLLLIMVLTLGAAVAVGALFDQETAGTEGVLLFLAIQTAVMLAGIYLVAVMLRGRTWTDLGFRPVSGRWIARGAAVAVIMLPVVGLINVMVQSLMGGPVTNPQLQVIAPSGFSWPALIGMTVMVGVVVPIAEEAAFRGVLYGWLRRHLGTGTSAVISGVLFSTLHGIPALMPSIAVLGIGLALVYERAGSLWASIAMHGTFNALMTVSLYVAMAQGASVPGTGG